MSEYNPTYKFLGQKQLSWTGKRALKKQHYPVASLISYITLNYTPCHPYYPINHNKTLGKVKLRIIVVFTTKAPTPVLVVITTWIFIVSFPQGESSKNFFC